MTEKPLIAIDCRMVNASGIGTCIRGWLRYLIPNNPQWNFVLLGAPADLERFEWSHYSNVSIIRFRSAVYSLREQFEWWRLRSAKFDALWVPHFNIPIFWQTKLMVTVHDVIFLAKPEYFSVTKRLYARFFFSLIARDANAVSFVSNFTCKEFLKLIRPPNGHFEVIHNGVEEIWFDRPQQTELQFQRIQGPYFVCIGNIKPNKNLRRLVDAFSLVANQIPHKLILVGKKDGFLTGDRDVESIAALKSDRVMFTGFVSDDALRDIVYNSDGLIFPSLYEGFGLPPLEAIACGCPIAVSDIDSLREVLGDTAIYFLPTDVDDIARAILELVRRPKPDFFAERGRMHARQFGWAVSAQRVKFLIAKILQ